MQKEEVDIFSVSESDIHYFDQQKPFGLKGFNTFYPIQRKEENDIKRVLVFVKEGIEYKNYESIQTSRRQPGCIFYLF